MSSISLIRSPRNRQANRPVTAEAARGAQQAARIDEVEQQMRIAHANLANARKHYRDVLPLSRHLLATRHLLNQDIRFWSDPLNQQMFSYYADRGLAEGFKPSTLLSYLGFGAFFLGVEGASATYSACHRLNLAILSGVGGAVLGGIEGAAASVFLGITFGMTFSIICRIVPHELLKWDGRCATRQEQTLLDSARGIDFEKLGRKVQELEAKLQKLEKATTWQLFWQGALLSYNVQRVAQGQALSKLKLEYGDIVREHNEQEQQSKRSVLRSAFNLFAPFSQLNLALSLHDDNLFLPVREELVRRRLALQTTKVLLNQKYEENPNSEDPRPCKKITDAQKQLLEDIYNVMNQDLSLAVALQQQVMVVRGSFVAREEGTEAFSSRLERVTQQLRAQLTRTKTHRPFPAHQKLTEQFNVLEEEKLEPLYDLFKCCRQDFYLDETQRVDEPERFYEIILDQSHFMYSGFVLQRHLKFAAAMQLAYPRLRWMQDLVRAIRDSHSAYHAYNAIDSVDIHATELSRRLEQKYVETYRPRIMLHLKRYRELEIVSYKNQLFSTLAGGYRYSEQIFNRILLDDEHLSHLRQADRCPQMQLLGTYRQLACFPRHEFNQISHLAATVTRFANFFYQAARQLPRQPGLSLTHQNPVTLLQVMQQLEQSLQTNRLAAIDAPVGDTPASACNQWSVDYDSQLEDALRFEIARVQVWAKDFQLRQVKMQNEQLLQFGMMQNHIIAAMYQQMLAAGIEPTPEIVDSVQTMMHLIHGRVATELTMALPEAANDDENHMVSQIAS